MPHAWQGFGTLQIHRYMYTDISLQSLNIIVPIANSNQCELDRALIKIGITELGLWWYKRNKTLQEKISQRKNYSFDFQSLAVCYTYVTDKMSVCYGSPKLWIWIKKNNNKKSCGQGLGSQKIDNVNMKLFGKKFEKPLNYNSAAFLTHCSNRVSLVSLSSTGGSLASCRALIQGTEWGTFNIFSFGLASLQSVLLLFSYININVSASLAHGGHVPNHRPYSLYRSHKHHHKWFIIISPPVTRPKPHALITKRRHTWLSVICPLCIHTPCSLYRPHKHILNVSFHCGYIPNYTLYALYRPK